MENLDKSIKKHLIDLEEDIKEFLGKSTNIEIITSEKLLTMGYNYSIELRKGTSNLLEIIYSKFYNKSFFHLVTSTKEIIELEIENIVNHKETILEKIKEIINEN